MKCKFKVGDYVTVVSDDTNVELVQFKGQVLKVVEFREENDYATIRLTKLDNSPVYSSTQFFREARFEPFKGDIKEIIGKKYICVKSACNNIYGGIQPTLDSAKKQVNDGSEHIIYELKPIVKLATKQIEETI